jgi:hypothetical protein
MLFIITKLAFERGGREELMKKVPKYDKKKRNAVNEFFKAGKYAIYVNDVTI